MTGTGWAIVTGASGGLGAAFTRALARRGHRVLAVGRSAESLTRVADEVNKNGGFVETPVCGLRCPGSGREVPALRTSGEGRARCPGCVSRGSRSSRRGPDEPPAGLLRRSDAAFHPALAHGEDVRAERGSGAVRAQMTW
jgi:nucleoside-diphosphate-sugar epimerase